MKIVVMAGGGLSCWYVVGKLLEMGREVEVWFAEAEQKDEVLVPAFLSYLEDNKVPVTTCNLRPSLGDLGLMLCGGQAHHKNGYWNTTSLLRVALISAAAQDFKRLYGDMPYEIAHGCVGLGNDQRRFTSLFGDLLPDHKVLTLLPEWAQETGTLSRSDMVDAIAEWIGKSDPELLAKKVWSTDGSVLGVSHEGNAIESHEDDWTQTPFVMTDDPSLDDDRDRVKLRFKSGNLVEIDGQTGTEFELLTIANERAGRRGVGRIGVMEDRIKGTKCRGVYEAPGVTLIAAALSALQELCFQAETSNRFYDLSRTMANDIYTGRWFDPTASNVRNKINELNASVSGEAVVTMRGGYLVIERIQADNVEAQIEQRFAHGGVFWS